MEHKTVRRLTHGHLAKLLLGPVCRGMRGGIEVGNPASSHLHRYKHIENAKASRHDDKEIAGQDRLDMIPHEGHPALRRNPFPRPLAARHVPSDGPGRKLNPQFEKEFGGNEFFSPERMLLSHSPDQRSYLLPQPWPTARPRFPTPEETEALSMPTDKGLRLDDNQGILPIEESRKQNHRQASRVGRSSRFDLELQIKCQLLAEEEILRPEGCLRARPENQESEGVTSKGGEGREQAKHGESKSRTAKGCHAAC